MIKWLFFFFELLIWNLFFSLFLAIIFISSFDYDSLVNVFQWLQRMMNLIYGIIIEDWAKMHGNSKFIIISLCCCAKFWYWMNICFPRRSRVCWKSAIVSIVIIVLMLIVLACFIPTNTIIHYKDKLFGNRFVQEIPNTCLSSCR